MARVFEGIGVGDLFELSPDPLVVADPEGRIAVANTAAEEMFGWPPGGLSGQSVSVLVPDDARDGHPLLPEGLAAPVSPKGAPERPPLSGRRSDGSVFPCSISVSTMELAGRRFVIAAMRDLTEQVQLESQLLQAQKMETVGRLAGGIAHDFNNLISIVNATAELAAAQLPDEHPVRDDLEIIREAGLRAASLTDQLLAFSRRQTRQPRVIDLNEVIRALAPMIARLIGEDIEVVLALSDQAPTTELDPSQLEQVIVNLAANARDAMPEGGTLSIETAEIRLDADSSGGRFEVAPGRYVMVAVSDTGAGMDAGTRERVFEPFFTTKPLGVGTGLGLSTVYGIVKQSGGYVWCYSELGEGTAFKLFFRQHDGPAEALGSRETAEAVGGDEVVLLVEDDDALRQVATRMLESAGYEVIEASSGEAAAEIASQPGRHLDLVFSDVVMPGIGPAELQERIRRAHPDVRFLFTSGYTSERMGVRGVIESETSFIGKPYALEELRAKVRAVLDEPIPDHPRD